MIKLGEMLPHNRVNFFILFKPSRKRRMNITRHISVITSTPRLKCGYKCDLVFRQYDYGHSTPLEFGGSEAKPTVEGDFGSKFLEEGFLKLPHILKDILDVLLEKVEYDDRSSLIRIYSLGDFLHHGRVGHTYTLYLSYF